MHSCEDLFSILRRAPVLCVCVCVCVCGRTEMFWGNTTNLLKRDTRHSLSPDIQRTSACNWTHQQITVFTTLIRRNSLSMLKVFIHKNISDRVEGSGPDKWTEELLPAMVEYVCMQKSCCNHSPTSAATMLMIHHHDPWFDCSSDPGSAKHKDSGAEVKSRWDINVIKRETRKWSTLCEVIEVCYSSVVVETHKALNELQQFITFFVSPGILSGVAFCICMWVFLFACGVFLNLHVLSSFALSSSGLFRSCIYTVIITIITYVLLYLTIVFSWTTSYFNHLLCAQWKTVRSNWKYRYNRYRSSIIAVLEQKGDDGGARPAGPSGPVRPRGARTHTHAPRCVYVRSV